MSSAHRSSAFGRDLWQSRDQRSFIVFFTKSVSLLELKYTFMGSHFFRTRERPIVVPIYLEMSE